MTTDLMPAAAALAAVLRGVRDDQLNAPTPCEDMTVAAILDHVDGFAWAFECAARKQTVAVDAAPRADADHLRPDWRTQIPDRLDAMVSAWREPSSWEGRTSVGGIDQTAEETGYVGLDELVVHSWDLARATGQDLAVDAASIEGALRFVEKVTASAPAGVPGLFGPALKVSDSASDLERLLALTGRAPDWRSTKW